MNTKIHHQQALAITRAFDNLAKAASHVRNIRFLLIGDCLCFLFII